MNRKYIRYQFWTCTLKRNNKNLFTDNLLDNTNIYFNISSLIDKGIIIFQNYPARLYLIIYRKKPIRFDILKNRLPGFYITRLINRPSDYINALRNKNEFILLSIFDKRYNIPFSNLIDDEEDDYISLLDEVFDNGK